ncbi:hypothetical protein EDD99_5683 [Streptomyces sp. 846.5]|nr:hypothetical protein [Streptomyces sp. 846.5]TDT97535.1 hypothetical protein EDD99_5683 [Streptomyces sp. 846.5]
MAWAASAAAGSGSAGDGLVYLLAFIGVMGLLGAWLVHSALHDPALHLPEQRTPRPVAVPPPPTCPVPPERQAWIESSMLWLVQEFGRAAARRQVALPTPDFFPVPFTGAKREIRALLVRVCAVMRVDPLFVWMNLFDGSDPKTLRSREDQRIAIGRYRKIWEFSIISLDRKEADSPAGLAATIAHELGHVRLIGEAHLTPDREDHEQLTDLLTVYLGMGIFTANAALTVRYRPTAPEDGTAATVSGIGNYIRTAGYLSQPDLGYALACYCRLRGETEPAWAAHLDPRPRRTLAQGLAYLAHASAIGAIGAGTVFPTTGDSSPGGPVAPARQGPPAADRDPAAGRPTRRRGRRR